MDGRDETGVTIMQMDAGLDTGPMISARAGPRRARGRRRVALRASGASWAGSCSWRPLDALEAGRPARRPPSPTRACRSRPRSRRGRPPLDPHAPGRRARQPGTRALARTSARPASSTASGSRSGGPGARAASRRRRALRVDGGRLVARVRRRRARDPRAPAPEPQPHGGVGLPPRLARRARLGRCAATRRDAATGVDPGARAWRFACCVRVDARGVRRPRPARRGPRAPARSARAEPGPPPGVRRRAAAAHARLADRRRRSTGPRRSSRRVRDVLRLGAYELAYCDGAPASAAVDQAVRARSRARRRRPRGAAARAGLVNAVLRAPGRRRSRRASTRSPSRRPAERRARSQRPGLDRRAALRGARPRATPRADVAAANRPPESALRWNPLRGPRATLERAAPAGHGARRPRGRGLRPVGPVRARGIGGLGPGPGHGPEPRVDAPGPRVARPAARRADPGPLRGAGREGHAPGGAHRSTGRGSRRVELRPARAAALRELARRHGRAARGGRGRRADGRARGPVRRRARRPAVHRPRRAGGPPRRPLAPAARRRHRAARRAPARAAGPGARRRAPRRPGRVLHLHPAPEENEESCGPPARSSTTSRRAVPRIPPSRARPERSCTLPGRDGTDGFFVARLRPHPRAERLHSVVVATVALHGSPGAAVHHVGRLPAGRRAARRRCSTPGPACSTST